MTSTQLARLITSLQYRKRMSLTIDDIESEIIAFLTVSQCQGKPVIIGGWEVFFDGEKLTINEAPVKNFKQLELFERSCR